jgi:hypothetical protein
MTNCEIWQPRNWLRKDRGRALQATALVHEAYVRLAGHPRHHVRQVLDSEYLLKELVRTADVEWGCAFEERPHFEGGMSASLRRPLHRRVGSHLPVAVDRETDGRGAEGPIGRVRTSGT